MSDEEVREQVKLLPRWKVMEVLDKNLERAGIRMTVRTYNQILLDLGFSLEKGDRQ